MADRPILMSAPMVRATLREADPKTQTRRIVKPKTEPWKDHHDEGGCQMSDWSPGAAEDVPGVDWWWVSAFAPQQPIGRCPYGQSGERLWVRESFWAYGKWVKNGYTKKGKQRWAFRFHRDQIVSFDANPDGTRIKRGEVGFGWVRRPGIHMPRWACRIELEVTGVRVQRLQEISEADAEAEGCERLDAERYEPDWKLCRRCGGTRLYDGIGPGMGVLPDQDCHDCDTYVKRYKHLWNSINGAGAWDANPWVWVVEFKRVKP